MPDVQAARITIPVTTNADQADKKLDKLDNTLKKTQGSTKKAGSEFSKFSGTAKLAGGIIGTVVVGSIVKMTSALIKAASDAQETRNKFTVTFRGVADEADAAAKNLASSFGLARSESEKLLSNTGDLLTGFGMSGAEALNLSKQVNTLAADLASFTNIEGGTQRASQALTAALLGEREQAKALGIVIRESDIQARLAAQGMSKLSGNALLQAKAFATLQIAQEQSKNALGDFARSQDSFANVSRTVQAQLKDLQVALGKGLIPMFTKVLIVVRNLLTELNKLFDDEYQARINSGEVRLNSLVKTHQKWVDIAKRNLAEAEKLKKSEGELISLRLKLENATAELRAVELKQGEAKKKSKEAIDKLKAAIDNESNTLNKNKNTRDAAKKSIEDINKVRKEALSILAATGDLSSQLALQEMQFAEQKKAVAAAGLNVAQLEQFQAQQRLNAVKNFITQSIEAEKGGILAKQEALNEAYFMALENDALSWEQKLAAQQAYNDASIALEQQRAREIAATTQLIGQGALQVSGILSSISQVRQNEMQQEIMNMEAAGASQEELDKKRKQLAKKAAKDQKKFGIISVIINTAMAVTKALASVPPPASYVLAAISAAAGLAQLAVIQSQPVPAQFGGSFVVPPGNEADSGLLRVNQGEEVSVTPVRETEQGGPKQITVMIDNRQFDAYLIDKMNQNLNNGSVQITRGGIVKTA